jgi:hypothetical protein
MHEVAETMLCSLSNLGKFMLSNGCDEQLLVNIPHLRVLLAVFRYLPLGVDGQGGPLSALRYRPLVG